MYDIKEALTETTIRTTLQDLPNDLKETYERIIERTYRGPGGKAKIDTMKRVFGWVADARRPLTIQELEEAVGLDPSDTYLHTDRLARNAGQRIVSDCGNLIIFNEEDDTVTFAHHTVQHYLYAPDGIHLSSQLRFLDLEIPDRYIGDLCLVYLSFSDFETQVANLTKQLDMDTEAAERLIWYSVPFASQMRNVFSWTQSWRGNARGRLMPRMNLALPVPSGPSENIGQKFVLLGYVIDFWAFHTADFRPTYWSGERLRHVALHLQLAFEHRPWNHQSYQFMYQAAMEQFQPRLDESLHQLTLTGQGQHWHACVRMYSWAFKYAIGSLLTLVDTECINIYLDLVRTQLGPEGLESGWVTEPEAIDTLTQFPRHSLPLIDSTDSSQSLNGSWGPQLLVSIIQAFVQRHGSERIASLMGFLQAEFGRWVEPDTHLDDVKAGTVALAWSYGTPTYVKNIGGAFLKDDRIRMRAHVVVAQSGQLSVNSFQNLLRIPRPDDRPSSTDWEIVFLLERYVSDKSFLAIRPNFTETRDPFIQHVLCAVLLLHKYPLKTISSVGFGNSSPGKIPKFALPVGDWQSTELGT
jgi:hypothetical protein